LQAHSYIKYPVAPWDREYTGTFLDQKINICKLTRGITNFAVQLFLNDFDKHANYKLRCPFKKVWTTNFRKNIAWILLYFRNIGLVHPHKSAYPKYHSVTTLYFSQIQVLSRIVNGHGEAKKNNPIHHIQNAWRIFWWKKYFE
jgi:hypothetical protein